MPYSKEQVHQALHTYFEEHDLPDHYNLFEVRHWREDVFALGASFEKAHGFRILDIEIYTIWSWHSNEWDGSWLSVQGPDDMRHFDDFVERYLPAQE